MTDSDVLERLRHTESMMTDEVLELSPCFAPEDCVNPADMCSQCFAKWCQQSVIIAIAEITRLRASPWVSVEERLPEVSERLGNDELLLVMHNGEPEFAFYDGPHSWDCPDKGWLTPEKVTHWTPIPPLDPTPEQV